MISLKSDKEILRRLLILFFLLYLPASILRFSNWNPEKAAKF